MIESISPEQGAKGEYITITGKNFGDNLGQVYFQKNGNENEKKFEGNMQFPSDCKNSVWNDKQIIVKFPNEADLDVGAKYFIQVQRSSDKELSSFGANFTYLGGIPGRVSVKLTRATVDTARV